MTTIPVPLTRRERFKLVGFFVILFGLAAHGYCYFNLLYSHDSLHIVRSIQENALQIGLGRFGIPIYLQIRGYIAMPTIVGILSLCYLTVAIFGIVSLLDLNSKPFIAVICAVLTTNESIIFLNASYIGVADVYMLSLLLAIGSVYITERYRYGIFLAPILLCFSLGLYQSYFQTAVFLFLILIAKRAFEKQSVRIILLSGVKALSTLLLSLLLYVLILRFLLQHNIAELVDSYNGLSNVGNFGTFDQLLQLLKETILYPMHYFLSPALCNSQVIAICNIILCLILLIALIRLLWHKTIPKEIFVLLILTLLLMPLGMNIIFFISNGLEHTLMIFSFFLVYVFLCYLLEQNQVISPKQTSNKKQPWSILQTIAAGCLIIIILNNISFANQLYLKKHLEFQNTLSTMTRILDRMEQTEGYTVAQTPVVFAGTLSQSQLSMNRKGFEEITGTGASQNFSTTYYHTYQWYLETILGYPIQLLAADEATMYAQMEQVQLMPSFPEKDCCQMINDVLVVKLSPSA